MPDPLVSAAPVAPVSAAPALGGRRAVLGVAAAAALAGAGVAWWRLQPAEVESGAEAALWALAFETPTGEPLAMQRFKGAPLIVNFWATWCPPCVEELPLLDSFFRQNTSNRWQVLGLAIDQPSAVRKFLTATPVTFPVGMAGLGGTDLSKSMGNLTGGLPFTIVLGADGRVAHRKMGKVSEADLAAWSRLG